MRLKENPPLASQGRVSWVDYCLWQRFGLSEISLPFQRNDQEVSAPGRVHIESKDSAAKAGRNSVFLKSTFELKLRAKPVKYAGETLQSNQAAALQAHPAKDAAMRFALLKLLRRIKSAACLVHALPRGGQPSRTLSTMFTHSVIASVFRSACTSVRSALASQLLN